MSKRSTSALFLLAALISVPPAWAASPATQSEADRLKELFERYVSPAGSGRPSGITVTPEGNSYRAVLDVKQILAPLETFGFDMDALTQPLLLTPNDSGTWHVTAAAMPPLTMRLKGSTVTVKPTNYKFDGTFDPKLGVFVDQSSTQDSMTIDQDGPAMSEHRRSGRAIVTGKAAPAGADRSDADIHASQSDLTSEITIQSPPEHKADEEGGTDEPQPASPPVRISYSIPSTALDLHVSGLRAWSLLDLWAFFVAHPNKESIQAAQEDLRGLLRAGLPFLTSFKESGDADSISVQSPLGEFKAAKFVGSLDTADFAGAGHAALDVSLDGLTVPTDTLPSWAAGLLPTHFDLHPTVTGLHVDAGLKELVDAFDLKADDLTPEQKTRILHAFWPGDGKVTLATSHIVSPLLDIKLEGEAGFGEGTAGRVTVVAQGLDKAIAALQAAGDADPTAMQIMAQFAAAKALAKPAPDGGLLWVIEGSAGAPVSVNGVPMK